ncbi:MAG: hypothetical protein PWP10_4232 [Clostridiales bacterium]|jgi:AraC-like DNA-binding protein|nr:hypothetical protein [Clostridiales bacterium]
MNSTQNIDLFRELVRCGSEIFTWCYDAEGQLLHSNCPDETLFATAFAVFNCKVRMLEHFSENDSPIILGTAIGLIWGAACDKSDKNKIQYYVIGPVFFLDLSMQAIENGFRYYSDLEFSLSWKHELLSALPLVPVAQSIILSRYMLMLHYCLTGERLQASDLNLKSTQYEIAQSRGEKRDRHKVWFAEQAMLQMVRNGDLNYKSALNNTMLISSGVPVQSSDPLRQGKDSIIVFISIVCRAAIEGGLSPEEAYSLGDSYIQAVERAADYSDLTPIASIMYDDFVQRVHRSRTNPKLSPVIQKCCDYIEMNIDSKIKASDLAAFAGYSEYYLTRKFKEETGFFINDYVKAAKIERAKVLLSSSDNSIQDISNQLGFTNRSYFSQVFRDMTGMTPVSFREQQQSNR